MKNILLKIEKVLLFVFLLLIPTQLGKHFWPEWSYIMGIRIDYLSPTLYLVDLVWIGLFLINCFKPFVFWTPSFKRAFFLVLLMVINIWIAKNYWLVGYKWLRIWQLIWMFWYLRENKEILKKFLYYIIPFWIILESLLGFGQVIKGGSLNGFFYWLGERHFNFNTIGVAQMAVFGRGFIRAYGTFSHPNSMGGFLLISLILWKIFSDKVKKKSIVWWWIVLWFGLMGIILTGSRIVILLLIVFLLTQLRQLNRLNYLSILSCLIIILGGLLIWKKGWIGGWDEFSLQKRIDLNWSALKMIKNNWFFGVGLGNFLKELPKYKTNNLLLQPVHNIFLLIISEIGILGVGIVILIIKSLKSYKLLKSFRLIVIFILIIAMMDHYWVTLPQNIWLLIIVLVLAIE